MNWHYWFPFTSVWTFHDPLANEVDTKYTIYTKVWGHPIILVSDRCITSSTQPHNHHKPTLAVEWHYWRAPWLSTWHRQRMPPFRSSNFCPARAVPLSTVSAVIMKWKRLVATKAQPQSVDSGRLNVKESPLIILTTPIKALWNQVDLDHRCWLEKGE